jgi:hypothetical protein
VILLLEAAMEQRINLQQATPEALQTMYALEK